jgi:hypothetical protein
MVVIMGKYNIVHPKKEGFAVIQYKKNIFSKMQWGIDDEKNNFILFIGKFEDVIVLNSNLIARKVKITKDMFKWELVKKTGERICQPKYDKCPQLIATIWKVQKNTSRYFYIAPINGCYAVLDAAGRQLCKPQYTRWREAYRDERESGIICEVARNGYWYKINTKGVELKTKYHERA